LLGFSRVEWEAKLPKDITLICKKFEEAKAAVQQAKKSGFQFDEKDMTGPDVRRWRARARARGLFLESRKNTQIAKKFL